MKKYSILAALLAVFVSCTALAGLRLNAGSDTIRIIHAGGVLWGRDKDGKYTNFAGSNSLEGLKQCIDAGVTYIELDFCFTADGCLACIHDWSPNFIETVMPNEPLTIMEFMNSKIYGNFTPLSLDEAARFLREHENITIVTDIKENFTEAVRLIAETGLTDRFAVQIYSEEDYKLVSEYGFEQVIYTLYKLDWSDKTDTEAIASFAETHDLAAIAFDKELCGVDGFVDELNRIGVPLYVYTVNGEAEVEKYLEMGIAGIYTDEVK